MCPKKKATMRKKATTRKKTAGASWARTSQNDDRESASKPSR